MHEVVYILFECIAYEGDTILGVYKSKQKAEQDAYYYIERQDRTYITYEVVEYELA